MFSNMTKLPLALLLSFNKQHLYSLSQTRQNAEVVVSVLQELFRRDAMKSVLSGRNEVTLAPLLSFIVRNVTDPKHCTVLVDVAHILAGNLHCSTMWCELHK